MCQISSSFPSSSSSDRIAQIVIFEHSASSVCYQFALWCKVLSVCSGGARHYLCLLVVHGTICVFWWCMALSVCSSGARHYLCVLVVHGTICAFWWCTALSVFSCGAWHYLCVLVVRGTISVSVCLTMITFIVSNKNCNIQLLVIEETE